jgi:hypothetical protein
MVVKVSSNKKQEKEEEEQQEEEAAAPSPEPPKTEKRSSYSWMKGVGLGSRTAEESPPPSPKKKAAKAPGTSKPRQRLDASVEKEVDRIIDSQDNEYVLSKPKYETWNLAPPLKVSAVLALPAVTRHTGRQGGVQSAFAHFYVCTYGLHPPV